MEEWFFDYNTSREICGVDERQITVISFSFLHTHAQMTKVTNMPPPVKFQPPVGFSSTATTSSPPCECTSGLPSAREKLPQSKQRDKMWESPWTYLVCFVIILCFPDEKIELGLGVVVIGLALNFIWALIQLDQSRQREGSAFQEKQLMAQTGHGNGQYLRIECL